MPIPAHNRLIVSGIFGSIAQPSEIWSFSLKTGPRVFASDADRQSAAVALKDAYTTHLSPLLPSWVWATRFRVSQHLELTGDTSVNDQGGYNQADENVNVPGSGPSSTVYPLSTALCVSLTTNRDGPTGKGRFYLPMPAMALSGDFRISEANATEVATAAKNFIAAINGSVIAPGPEDDVVVSSSKGYNSLVTGVRVGRVPDTMRSRRSAQLEGWSSVAL